MRVAHFNTFDSGGGATKATVRLHSALMEAGCDSTLMVAHKAADVPQSMGVRTIGTRFYRAIDVRVLRNFYPYRIFSPDLLGTPSASLIDPIKHVDVIHLHWIANFLSSRQIRQLHERTSAPIVWTLLDMAPLTGGCHYAHECVGYKSSCGHCPEIRSHLSYDLSRWTWQQKHKNFRKLPITLVAGSSWIAACARASSLFCDGRIVRISVPIDDKLFCPIDPVALREQWQLPVGAKVIFMAAYSLADERKGMRYLRDAMKLLKARLSDSGSNLNVWLLVAGDCARAQQLGLPFPTRFLGDLADDPALSSAYQSADIFVCPSIEDAGPMMIPESMMCGTPVVAFNSGGALDLIETTRNGYLARYKDSSDLANGIYTLLSSPHLQEMRFAAREKALSLHATSLVASQYLDLYRSITEG